MPKNFIQKTFGRWLSSNRSRFRFQPIIAKKGKGSIIDMRFMGISQKIGCVITRHYAGIYVNHHGECWDILTSFVVEARKSSAGYYCEGCEPDKREFFATREELWERHCFEPLLKWVNKNLDESRWVCLFATKDTTWARIKEKNDIKVDSEYFVHAFPVVERMNRRQ